MHQTNVPAQMKHIAENPTDQNEESSSILMTTREKSASIEARSEETSPTMISPRCELKLCLSLQYHDSLQ